MPFVRISLISPTIDHEQIRNLQQGATELMASVMRKEVAGIAVLVEHVDRCGWSIAGASIAVGAHVEATIGRGTNTPDEKARFMSGMWRLLRAELGFALREETYLVIHEIDTNAYGRGGLTRAERDRRRQTTDV
jgi:4-oxalocrotonate tautomerase